MRPDLGLQLPELHLLPLLRLLQTLWRWQHLRWSWCCYCQRWSGVLPAWTLCWVWVLFIHFTNKVQKFFFNLIVIELWCALMWDLNECFCCLSSVVAVSSRIEIRDKPPSKYVIRCNFLKISVSGSTELATACQHSKYFSFIFNYFSEYFSESGVWRGVDDCHPEHWGTIYRSSVQPGGVWSVYGDLSDFGNCKETIEAIRIFGESPFKLHIFWDVLSPSLLDTDD